MIWGGAWIQPASSEGLAFYDGNTLLRSCERLRMECFGYVHAAVEVIEQQQSSGEPCLIDVPDPVVGLGPPDVEAVVKYLRAHPEFRHEAVINFVVIALHESYPCDQLAALAKPIGFRVHDLLRSCDEMNDFCLGYAAGVADAMLRRLTNEKCAVQFPAGIELSQVRDIGLNALRHRGLVSDELASTVFNDALATAFPCHPS